VCEALAEVEFEKRREVALEWARTWRQEAPQGPIGLIQNQGDSIGLWGIKSSTS
jgi:hypothetical protein